MPEVKDYQIYAGTAAPINFNGLVRHYFIRSGANVGIFRSIWWTSMNGIAAATRLPGRYGQLQAIASAAGATSKVVEVPPCPPVWSP